MRDSGKPQNRWKKTRKTSKSLALSTRRYEEEINNVDDERTIDLIFEFVDIFHEHLSKK